MASRILPADRDATACVCKCATSGGNSATSCDTAGAAKATLANIIQKYAIKRIKTLFI